MRPARSLGCPPQLVQRAKLSTSSSAHHVPLPPCRRPDSRGASAAGEACAATSGGTVEWRCGGGGTHQHWQGGLIWAQRCGSVPPLSLSISLHPQGWLEKPMCWGDTSVDGGSAAQPRVPLWAAARPHSWRRAACTAQLSLPSPQPTWHVKSESALQPAMASSRVPPQRCTQSSAALPSALSTAHNGHHC